MPTTYVRRAFYYDALGRLPSESTSVNGSVTATIAYAYDPLGHLKTTTSGSGVTAQYSGDISSWAWTQHGQTAKTYGFSYDGAHRLTAGQYYSGGSAPIPCNRPTI